MTGTANVGTNRIDGSRLERTKLLYSPILQPHALLSRVISGFIHSFYLYSASSNPLLLTGAPDTARILCWIFMPNSHRQLRVKDLPKVPMWQRGSNTAKIFSGAFNRLTTSCRGFVSKALVAPYK